MALAVRQGCAIETAEVVAERHDGTCAVLLACPSALRDETGTVIGAVNALLDVSNFKHNQQLTQRLAAIVESSQDAIVSKDLDGIVQSWNRGAQELFGYRPEEIVGKPIALLIPADRRDEESNILSRLRRGERTEHYETVRLRKDGTPLEVSLTVSPLRDASGQVIGASKVARDISARKRAEEQQELLLREMAHRIKNLFALVSGMVGLSTRYAHTPQELAEVLQARMWALYRAHELTLPAQGRTGETNRATTLDELARAILSPHVDADGKRLVLDGPHITIRNSAVTSLALLLHEFATNAAKYGALATTAGRIHLQWRTEQEELHLSWRESGGPRIEQPARGEGFGSLLARQTAVNQFHGRIAYDWRPEGLVVHLWARKKWLCGEASA